MQESLGGYQNNYNNYTNTQHGIVRYYYEIYLHVVGSCIFS